MIYLDWSGTYKIDSFEDGGTPADPSPVTRLQVQGIASSEVWGNASDVYTIRGTAGADLIYLHTSNFDTPRLINVKQINGGSGNDLIDLTSPRFQYGSIKIDGGTGNDWLLGNKGSDSVFGRSGQDWIKGYSGNDLLDGGSGNDRVYGGRGNDKLTGSNGNDHLYGQLGKDILSGGQGSVITQALVSRRNS
jgi:Ca2+-binding RTX toxin-like protein